MGGAPGGPSHLLMGIVLTQRGPLVVAETTADAARIQKELLTIDPDLVLQPHLTEDGRHKWSVSRWVAPGKPLLPVCYWDDPITGEPWPLTFGLVEKVRQMTTRSPEDILAEAKAANRERYKRLQADAIETYGDILVDGIPRTKETRSAVLHRGVGLRMARDKRRARGEKC